MTNPFGGLVIDVRLEEYARLDVGSMGRVVHVSDQDATDVRTLRPALPPGDPCREKGHLGQGAERRVVRTEDRGPAIFILAGSLATFARRLRLVARELNAG